ncbi:hypothetical protein MFRU_017g00850 [Monilinia fructicola]|nr:hypothetical protein MFRU_017g00850 [Monilinia fructicola]
MSMFTLSDWGLLKSSLERVHTLDTGERDPYFNPHTSSQWFSFVTHGNWDALVAFIICLLPNLRSLNIVNHASGCPYGYPYLETIFNRAASLQQQSQHRGSSPCLHSFPKLTHLHLAKHDLIHHPRMGFEILRFIPFLNLPSIRTVSGHMISDFHFPSSTDPEQAHSSPFTFSTFYAPPLPNFNFHTTSLTLSHTVLATATVPKFFSYFTSLKYLSWSWNYDIANARRDELEYSFDVEVFLNSISHLSGCLEVLKLRISPVCAGSVVSRDNWIPTLSSFKTLKSLEISNCLLDGSHGQTLDDFPRSLILSESEKSTLQHSLQEYSDLFFENLPDGLERLVWRECDVRVLDGVFRLFESKNEVRIPKRLKVLEMHFPETNYERWEEKRKAMGKKMWSELIIQAQLRGITIRVFGTPGEKPDMIQMTTSNPQDQLLSEEKNKREGSCEECEQQVTQRRLRKMNDWVVYGDNGNNGNEDDDEVEVLVNVGL